MTSESADLKKLPLKTKIGFGIGDLGGNLFFTAMMFWSMTYLTDTVGVPAALAGIAVMIGRAWDAVTDPMMAISLTEPAPGSGGGDHTSSLVQYLCSLLPGSSSPPRLSAIPFC